MKEYVWKTGGELARAVAVAVIAYAATAINAQGVPETREAIIALLTGALPVIYAAVRAVLARPPIAAGSDER